MGNEIRHQVMPTYSQAGQDKWILSLFPEGYKGFFMDIGCNDPKFCNNTLLLEEHGWTGIAVDIVDYSKEWEERKTKFIHNNALNVAYKFIVPPIVDYLSLDVDDLFANYEMLYLFITHIRLRFKAITIEHNLYQGKANERERKFQRMLLVKKGYKLMYPDVEHGGNKFEDWWINPKYI